MPDPRELMMLAQQGGGGGAPQMPPAGGGDPRMAAAMQQKLAQLMQDPVARAGIQAHMQGGDPREAGARMAVQQGPPPGMTVGRGPTTDQELMDSSTANQQIRGNLPIQRGKGDDYTGFTDSVDPMEDPRQTPMPMKPGEEQNMVSDEIDRKGATFDGNEAPTQNDIERLQADPSSANVKAFDLQFGKGSAVDYLDEESGEPINPDGSPKEQ